MSDYDVDIWKILLVLLAVATGVSIMYAVISYIPVQKEDIEYAESKKIDLQTMLIREFANNLNINVENNIDVNTKNTFAFN